VTVGVEGDSNAGVPEKLLHELRMYVPLEQERRARMPEIVEGYLRQIRTLEDRRKGPQPEVGRVDKAAALAREYKALILVQSTGP